MPPQPPASLDLAARSVPMRREGFGVPTLSIIIASVNGRELLERAMRALDGELERESIEVIVVERGDAPDRHWIHDREPGAKLVFVDRRTTIPAMRFAGLAHATAPAIGFLEDHVEVEPGWTGAMLETLTEHSAAAVGGAVENGKRGLVSSAAFLSEYTRYMNPVAEGAWSDLPGNNIVYNRDHLLRHANVLAENLWESWINEKLEAEGETLISTGKATVRHIKPFRFFEFAGQRFHYSRSFAGMRRLGQSPMQRLVYAAGSSALPALLIARLVRELAKKGRLSPGVFAALPLVLLFQAVGAIGESIGYLFGPGTSLEKVE